MKTIVAVDENWAIGKDGKMLVHIPGDLRYFKEKTLGKAVAMGRATLDSMKDGKPLPKRTNIVLSRNEELKGEFILVNTIQKLIDEARRFGEENVFVIGGGQIYRALLPECDEAYVTKIRGVYPADTYFPNLDEDPDWEQVSESKVQEDNGIQYTFCLYRRI